MSGPVVVVAPRGEHPASLDAVVEEEDTYLALSAEAVVRYPGEHPLRVMTRAHEAAPLGPGSVVVRRTRPLRLLAVVHALDQDPTWRVEWVRDAVGNVVGEADRRRLREISMPLLGTVHGRLPLARAVEITRRALVGARTLERVWLAVPPDDVFEVDRLLRAF